MPPGAGATLEKIGRAGLLASGIVDGPVGLSKAFRLPGITPSGAVCEPLEMLHIRLQRRPRDGFTPSSLLAPHHEWVDRSIPVRLEREFHLATVPATESLARIFPN